MVSKIVVLVGQALWKFLLYLSKKGAIESNVDHIKFIRLCVLAASSSFEQREHSANGMLCEHVAL